MTIFAAVHHKWRLRIALGLKKIKGDLMATIQDYIRQINGQGYLTEFVHEAVQPNANDEADAKAFAKSALF
jgi:hypothetical protein